MIERLIARDVAYLAEDGSVYFAIGRFPGYGRLSRLDTREVKAGARVARSVTRSRMRSSIARRCRCQRRATSTRSNPRRSTFHCPPNLPGSPDDAGLAADAINFYGGGEPFAADRSAALAAAEAAAEPLAGAGWQIDIRAERVIIACGGHARRLGFPGSELALASRRGAQRTTLDFTPSRTKPSPERVAVVDGLSTSNRTVGSVSAREATGTPCPSSSGLVTRPRIGSSPITSKKLPLTNPPHVRSAVLSTAMLKV